MAVLFLFFDGGRKRGAAPGGGGAAEGQEARGLESLWLASQGGRGRRHGGENRVERRWRRNFPKAWERKAGEARGAVQEVAVGVGGAAWGRERLRRGLE